jgi:hypothetical protein
MIQLKLINANIIYDTDCVTSRAGIIREWIMPFVSSTLKSFEKWRSPLFGATGNFNHQILPYNILFLTFINTNVFYLLSVKFSR